MKNARLFTVWIGLAVTLIHPTNASAQGPAGYDFLCRGPLRLVTAISAENSETTSQGFLIIDISPNRDAAGFQGSSLRAGKCAWVDRPLDAGAEPRFLYYRLTWPTGSEEVGGAEIIYPFHIPSHLGASIIVQCSGDPKCVIEFHNVVNTGYALEPLNDPTVVRYVIR